MTKNGLACATNVATLANTNAVAGSSLLGDQWLVAAAAPTGGPSVYAGDGPSIGNINPPRLHAETATIDGWHIALAQLPGDATRAHVEIPTGPHNGTGITLTRTS